MAISGDGGQWLRGHLRLPDEEKSHSELPEMTDLIYFCLLDWFPVKFCLCILIGRRAKSARAADFHDCTDRRVLFGGVRNRWRAAIYKAEPLADNQRRFSGLPPARGLKIGF